MTHSALPQSLMTFRGDSFCDPIAHVRWALRCRSWVERCAKIVHDAVTPHRQGLWKVYVRWTISNTSHRQFAKFLCIESIYQRWVERSQMTDCQVESVNAPRPLQSIRDRLCKTPIRLGLCVFDGLVSPNRARIFADGQMMQGHEQELFLCYYRSLTV